MSRVERVEGFMSRVEGFMSRVEGFMSRVEGTMSRFEGNFVFPRKIKTNLTKIIKYNLRKKTIDF